MPGAEFFRQFGFLIMREFLDGGCRATLAEAMREGKRTPSTVAINGQNVLDQDQRHSEWAFVSELARSDVQRRLAALKPALEAHYRRQLSELEPPRFLVYDEGAFFAPHRDARADGSPDGRQVGIVVFVNGERNGGEGSAYRGGALTFYELLPAPPWSEVGFPLIAEPGLLVAFPAHLVHEVRPVTAGQRLAINTFYHGVRVTTGTPTELETADGQASPHPARAA